MYNEYLSCFLDVFDSKINPSDCVDMACDAMVKALLVDMDGSLLGQAGSVIPQSEYQWNGNPAYMLGDYRVPKEMQVTVDGQRIPMETLAPHKGNFFYTCQCKIALLTNKAVAQIKIPTLE